MNASNSRQSGSDAKIRSLAAEWVTRVDAGLSACDEAELAAWLAADGEHRTAYERCRGAWSRLDLSVGGESDLLVRELDRRASRRRRRRVACAAAAAFSLAVGALLFRPSTVEVPPAPRPEVATARMLAPERRVLPDGSLVELNGDARLAVSFDDSRRLVTLLKGEAHFEVVPDSHRPFHVVASGVDVRAVGTAFSVQVDSAEVAVVVSHGRVAVSRPLANDRVAGNSGASADSPAPAVASLGVGERLVVPTQPDAPLPEVLTVAAADLEVLLAWRRPAVEFSGASLTEALALLQRHGRDGVRFELAEPELAEVRVSGVFRLDRTEAFIRLLEHGFDIEAMTRADGTIVLSRSK